MTDERLASRMRALLACLADDCVSAADLIGVARAGLILAVLTEGRSPEVHVFRDRLRSARPVSTDVDTLVARYIRRASPLSSYFVVIWREADVGDDHETFERLWATLDTLEGERLAASLAG